MAARESNVEMLYQELLKRFSETRKLNMRLLEEKRELLLRIQANTRPCSGRQSLNEHSMDYSGSDETLTLNNFQDIMEDDENNGSGAKLRKLTEINSKLEESYKKLKEDHEKLESDFLKLREESKEDREENTRLRQLIEKLSCDLQNFKQPQNSRVESQQSKDSFNFEDIEALKQQLLAYKEDFDEERKEKETSHSRNEALEGRLKDANERVKKLSLENMQFKKSLSQVRQQKEHLLSEMRRLSTTSLPFSPVLESHIPVEERLRRDAHEYEDVIPRSKGPNIRRSPPSAFKGAPAFEDMACF